MTGNFKIINGDCLEALSTTADNSVDMVFTDPPYGHNNNDGDLIANWEKALGRGEPGAPRPIANDGAEANELIQAVLPELYRVLKPGSCCCVCCCGGGGPDPQFARWSLWMDKVFQFKQMIIWDKGPMGMGWHYRRSYEVVLVGQKRGAACAWFDNSSKVENIIRPGQHGIRKIIPGADEHPTPKPPELAAHFIRLHTQPGATVLDPFMGGGSTGVAACLNGRNFVGVELEPEFFVMSERCIAKALKPNTYQDTSGDEDAPLFGVGGGE